MKKEIFITKKPYVFAISAALLCTFLTALGSAVPQILGLEETVQMVVTAGFISISALIGTAVMKLSRHSLLDYGFRAAEKGTCPLVWWYAPLLLIEIFPIAFYGFSKEISGISYVFIAIFTIAVGFNEEIYFRGLALKALGEKGIKHAVIGSSVIFGILHIANAFNGASPLYLILQIFFAFIVGFVLAEIVSITKSIWLAIIWHALHDFIAMTTSETFDGKAIMISALQVIFLLIFALGIWKNASSKEIR